MRLFKLVYVDLFLCLINALLFLNYFALALSEWIEHKSFVLSVVCCVCWLSNFIIYFNNVKEYYNARRP